VTLPRRRRRRSQRQALGQLRGTGRPVRCACSAPRPRPAGHRAAPSLPSPRHPVTPSPPGPRRRPRPSTPSTGGGGRWWNAAWPGSPGA
jgi:hypothetical protein